MLMSVLMRLYYLRDVFFYLFYLYDVFFTCSDAQFTEESPSKFVIISKLSTV